MVSEKVYIYTDGSCLGNPGPGGWAAILRYKDKQKELSGSDAATTNNRMELMAAIRALEELRSPCEVELSTDSKYVRDGINEWLANWLQRGWRRSSGKPVLNVDLWQRLYAATQRHEIQWHWIKGHSGHVYNEQVDQMAVAAARRMQSQSECG